MRTVCSHIGNMITGVKHGFEYKMKMVYAHFPINVNCDKANGSKDTNVIEIRNFLGEKVVRRIVMQEGCKVERTSEKDEIMITGNSIEAVGISQSQIQQTCREKPHPDTHLHRSWQHASDGEDDFSVEDDFLVAGF